MFHCFGYRNFLCIRGVSHDFLSELLVSQHQKIFSGVPFSDSEIFWFRKNLWIRGGWNITIFRQNCFDHRAEKNRTGILQCFTDSGIETFYALEG